jgi:hypothetical protein
VVEQTSHDPKFKGSNLAAKKIEQEKSMTQEELIRKQQKILILSGHLIDTISLFLGSTKKMR